MRDGEYCCLFVVESSESLEDRQRAAEDEKEKKAQICIKKAKLI